VLLLLIMPLPLLLLFIQAGTFIWACMLTLDEDVVLNVSNGFHLASSVAEGSNRQHERIAVEPFITTSGHQEPASADVLELVTVGIKATPQYVGRRRSLQALLRSIRAMYGAQLRIHVAHELHGTRKRAAEAHLKLILVESNALPVLLPNLAGLSAGRNALVESVTTPFVLISDDDVYFHEGTSLGTLLRVLLSQPKAALACGCYDRKGFDPYCGSSFFETDGVVTVGMPGNMDTYWAQNNTHNRSSSSGRGGTSGGAGGSRGGGNDGSIACKEGVDGGGASDMRGAISKTGDAGRVDDNANEHDISSGMAEDPEQHLVKFCRIADIGHNFFLARVDVLRQYRWDPRQKMMEHESFFFHLHVNRLPVIVCDRVTVEHKHPNAAHEPVYRKQSERFQPKRYMQYFCKNFPWVTRMRTPYFEWHCTERTYCTLPFRGTAGICGQEMDWSSDNEQLLRLPQVAPTNISGPVLGAPHPACRSD